jgi:hypothetical protein
MNTTAFFPGFEPLVKPFKFAVSLYEYKVIIGNGNRTRLREPGYFYSQPFGHLVFTASNFASSPLASDR